MTDQTMKASYIKGSTNIKGIQNDNDRYEKRIKELQSRLKKNNTTQGSRDNSLGNQNSYVSVKNTGSKVNEYLEKMTISPEKKFRKTQQFSPKMMKYKI